MFGMLLLWHGCRRQRDRLRLCDCGSDRKGQDHQYQGCSSQECSHGLGGRDALDPAIPPRILEVPGQEIAELQHSHKLVKEEGTAEVRQTSMFTGDSDISRGILHAEEILPKC